MHVSPLLQPERPGKRNPPPPCRHNGRGSCRPSLIWGWCCSIRWLISKSKSLQRHGYSVQIQKMCCSRVFNLICDWERKGACVRCVWTLDFPHLCPKQCECLLKCVNTALRALRLHYLVLLIICSGYCLFILIIWLMNSWINLWWLMMMWMRVCVFNHITLMYWLIFYS